VTSALSRGVETPRCYAKPVKNRLRDKVLVRFERTSSYQPMIFIIGSDSRRQRPHREPRPARPPWVWHRSRTFADDARGEVGRGDSPPPEITMTEQEAVPTDTFSAYQAARAYNSEFQDLSNSFNPGIRCYMRKWPTNNSFSHHIPGSHPEINEFLFFAQAIRCIPNSL
jgi:hypothetical protein